VAQFPRTWSGEIGVVLSICIINGIFLRRRNEGILEADGFDIYGFQLAS